MIATEFDMVVRLTFERLQQISATKGREYVRDSYDCLDNFKRIGAQLKLDPKVVLTVYLQKHLDSISTYVTRGGEGEYAEPIEGRIDDAILYLLLLKGLCQDSMASK
jgi:hypothetical protein